MNNEDREYFVNREKKMQETLQGDIQRSKQVSQESRWINQNMITNGLQNLAYISLMLHGFDQFTQRVEESLDYFKSLFDAYREYDFSEHHCIYGYHKRNYGSDPRRIFDLFSLAIISGIDEASRHAISEIKRVPDTFPQDIPPHAEHFYASKFYEAVLENNLDEAKTVITKLEESKKFLPQLATLAQALCSKDSDQMLSALEAQLKHHAGKKRITRMYTHIDTLATTFYALARKQGIDISLESIPEKYKQLIPQTVIQQYRK